MRNYPYVPSMVQAITVLTVLKMMTKAQTSCGSGSINGKIMYERLPNIQLQGFDEDIVRDTMPPFMVLEKCQDLCLKDRNSQNIVRACASFDFQPGSRIATYNGGPEYEESTCYLSPNQARPEGMGSLMIVPNSVHFNEICLTSNRPDRECPNRRYVFERHPRKRLKLPMPDVKEIQASNRSDCEDKCLDEFSFVCRSATFDSNQGMCILSRFTRRTHPELLQDDPEAEYLENTCLSAERRCDGLAVFIKEENRRLGGPFEVDSYTNITLEECQGMCVRAEKYFCRSIEYDEMTKQCTISEEDSVSQKDDISLASSPTHHFYDFACLDSPTSQPNRHQRNLEPRGSEYPDNSVTSHLFTGKKPDTAFQRYRNSRLGGEHHSEISGRSLSECLDECLRQPSFQCRSAEYSERYRTCRLTRYNQKDGMRIIYDADYDYYENLMLGGDSEGRPGGEGSSGTYRPGEYPHRPSYPRPSDDYPGRPGDYPIRPGGDYPRPGGDYPIRPGGDYPIRPGGDYPIRPGGDYPIRPGGDYPIRPGGDYPIRPGGDYPIRPGGDYPIRPVDGYPHRPTDDYPSRPRPPSYRPSSSGGDYENRDRYYPKPPYSRVPPDDYPIRPLGPPRDGYHDRYPDSRYPDRYPERYPPPSKDRYPYYPPSSSGDKYPSKYPRPSGDRYGDRDRYGGDRDKYGGYGSRYGERYPDYEYPVGPNYRPSSSGGDKYGGGSSYDHKYGGGRYPDRYGDRYGDKYGDREPGGDRYGDRFGNGNRYDYYGDEKNGGNRWFFRPDRPTPDRRPIGRPVDPIPPPYDPIRPSGGGRPPYGGRPISPGPDGPIYDSFGGIGPNRPYSSRCDEGGNFKQLGTRQRARKEFIRKFTQAPSLVACERECNDMRDFICRSFNYRDVPPGGYETNRENCELSDRDSRDMEINNPQYFETGGTFEYYERSLSRHGVDGDCLDVSQVCNEDGMEFTLRTPEGFYGRIYTYGYYDRCFFRGNGGTVNVLRISGAQGYPECGTQRYGDTMTNIVVVQFSDYVQTGKDKRFNLTCLFRGPGEAVVSSGFIGAGSGSPVPIEYLPAENTLSSKVRLMILYQGRPTTTIAVGDPLTFRLEAQDGYNYVTDIFATNVVARDPYTGRSVQLIDRFGCPVDTFVFPELDRGRSGDSLEARFNAFKIPESNFLVFEATVKTCKDGCQPAYCPSGSGRSEPSFGRRRRSINDTIMIEGLNNTIVDIQENNENKTEETTSVVSFPQADESTHDTEKIGSESPEFVREMIEVFDSREELQQEAQRAELVPETVCLTKGEYHGLVTVLFSLLALLLTVVVLVSWGYRRYWSVIQKNIIVNRSSSNISTFSTTSYPNTRSSNVSGGISMFGTGFGKSFAGFGRARHFPSLPRDDPDSPNPAPGGPFEDPSEPIYIDPSLFERSRSLRSIAVTPKRRTSISS